MNGLKSAIDAGDIARVQRVLDRDPAARDRYIIWSDRYGGLGRIFRPNRSTPLHYLCDRVFANALSPGIAERMARALIDAGAVIDAPHPTSGDVPLIAAASLGATSVGLVLIEAGAELDAKGLFGATATHWAALLGDLVLLKALVRAGAAFDNEDERYRSTPLGWAIHGLKGAPAGSKGEQAACARSLIAAGAGVRDEWRAEPSLSDLFAP